MANPCELGLDFSVFVCVFPVHLGTYYRSQQCVLCSVLPAARGRRWTELTLEEQRSYVMRLLDALEVTDRDKRLKVARAILYLAQGAWAQYTTTSGGVRSYL